MGERKATDSGSTGVAALCAVSEVMRADLADRWEEKPPFNRHRPFNQLRL
jgi:hypothetical protein